jgi:hypothetical protein
MPTRQLALLPQRWAVPPRLQSRSLLVVPPLGQIPLVDISGETVETGREGGDAAPQAIGARLKEEP